MAILKKSAKQAVILIVWLLPTSLYAQNLTLTSGLTRTTSASSEYVTVTQNNASTDNGFVFVSLGSEFVDLEGATTPSLVPSPSTITVPPSLSSMYAKCHNNCTIYPGYYMRSWTWSKMKVLDHVTLATEFVIVDPIHNLTSTSTKYNTEVLSMLPTDTNSDGIRTAVISNSDSFAGTPVFVTLTYPTQYQALEDRIAWNGTLFSTQSITFAANATQTAPSIVASCLSYPRGVAEALPTIHAEYVPQTADAKDSKGWVYSLVPRGGSVELATTARFYADNAALHTCTVGSLAPSNVYLGDFKVELAVPAVSFLTETSTISGFVGPSDSSSTSSPSTMTTPLPQATPLQAAIASPPAQASSTPDPISSPIVVPPSGSSVVVPSSTTTSASAVGPAPVVSSFAAPPAPAVSSSVVPPAPAPAVSSLAAPPAPAPAVSSLAVPPAPVVLSSTMAPAPAASYSEAALAPAASSSITAPAPVVLSSSIAPAPAASSSTTAPASAIPSSATAPASAVSPAAASSLPVFRPSSATPSTTSQSSASAATYAPSPAAHPASTSGSSSPTVAVATTASPSLPMTSISPAGSTTGAAESGTLGSGSVAPTPNATSASSSSKQSSKGPNATSSITSSVPSPTASPSGSSASQAGTSQSTSTTMFTGFGILCEPALLQVAFCMTIVLGLQFANFV